MNHSRGIRQGCCGGPAPLAPVKAAVLPLIKKDGLPELAQKIMNDLKYDFNCRYEEKDSIADLRSMIDKEVNLNNLLRNL